MPTPPTYTSAFGIIGTEGGSFYKNWTWAQFRTPVFGLVEGRTFSNPFLGLHSMVYVEDIPAGYSFMGTNLYTGYPGGGGAAARKVNITSTTCDGIFVFGGFDQVNDPPSAIDDYADIEIDQVNVSLVGASVSMTGISLTVSSEAINNNGVAQSFSCTLTSDLSVTNIVPL